MHMDEVTICYGMTETSPVSTQTRADDPLEQRVGDRRPRAPARRGQDRRPGDRRDRARAASPASCAPAATRVMLGYWDDPERTAEAIDRARLDAHRRPRDDGRRGLRQHRRAHQGHGHPRRRERLPARDRGVPLHATPTIADVQVDRRARRALRRGADAPGSSLRDGADARRRTSVREFCRGQHRPLQDAALRAASSTSSR